MSNGKEPEPITYGTVKTNYDEAVKAFRNGSVDAASIYLTHAILQLDVLAIEAKTESEAVDLKTISDIFVRFRSAVERKFKNREELQEIIDEFFKNMPVTTPS